MNDNPRVGIGGTGSARDPGLLIEPAADCGLETIGLSGLKKLDLRRPFPGVGGSFAMESIVRSDKVCRLSGVLLPPFSLSSSFRLFKTGRTGEREADLADEAAVGFKVVEARKLELDVRVLRDRMGTGGLDGILKLLSVAGLDRVTRLDLEGVFRIVGGCNVAGIGSDDFGSGKRDNLGIPVERTG